MTNAELRTHLLAIGASMVRRVDPAVLYEGRLLRDILLGRDIPGEKEQVRARHVLTSRARQAGATEDQVASLLSTPPPLRGPVRKGRDRTFTTKLTVELHDALLAEAARRRSSITDLVDEIFRVALLPSPSAVTTEGGEP